MTSSEGKPPEKELINQSSPCKIEIEVENVDETRKEPAILDEAGVKMHVDLHAEQEVKEEMSTGPDELQQPSSSGEHIENAKIEKTTALNKKGPEKFPCKICKKEFTLKQNMLRHVKVHNGDKPFKCKFCVKTFFRKDLQVDHEFVHINQNNKIDKKKAKLRIY